MAISATSNEVFLSYKTFFNQRDGLIKNRNSLPRFGGKFINLIVRVALNLAQDSFLFFPQ
ncbi:MAG: hypothetical protein ACM3RX_08455 [Methanococcaceae archaeon]